MFYFILKKKKIRSFFFWRRGLWRWWIVSFFAFGLFTSFCDSIRTFIFVQMAFGAHVYPLYFHWSWWFDVFRFFLFHLLNFFLCLLTARDIFATCVTHKDQTRIELGKKPGIRNEIFWFHYLVSKAFVRTLAETNSRTHILTRSWNIQKTSETENW